MLDLYKCNSHQLFNCSINNNQYYVWNGTDVSIVSVDFATPLKQVKVLMTYFTSDDASLVIAFTTINETEAVSAVTLTANEDQFNFTFPLLSAINRITITLNTTGNVAFNRIIFCSESEG